MRSLVLGLSVWAAGCFSDSASGSGVTGGDSTSSGSTSSSSTSSGSTGDGSGTASETATGTGVDCVIGGTQRILWVGDAGIIAGPFVEADAWDWPAPQPRVFYSTVPGQEANFQFDVPCTGLYYTWILAWDLVAGAFPCGATQHADSLLLFDPAGREVFHSYGCTTCDGGPDRLWAWRAVDDFTGGTCDDLSRYAVMIAEGPFALRLQNREVGTFAPGNEDVAAVAAVLITDDPDYDPNQDFPTPDPG